MNNFIECYPRALSQEQCNSIINTFKHDKNKKLGRLGGRVDHSLKHSTDSRCRFTDSESISGDWSYHPKHIKYNQLLYPALIGGLQLYTGTYEFMMELSSWRIYNGYNIQYYGEGQGYKVLHCEHENHANAMYRILAWMFYLNDAQSGTYFPHQDITLTPKAGDLWIWPAFWTHAHRGVTPNVGDKYIATGWCEFASKNWLADMKNQMK